MKTAIVYYSLSGNTRSVAQKLSDRLGADLIELVPKKQFPTKGFSKFFWGGKSAVMAERPELLPYSFDASSYDRIILGAPVWAFTITPPLRTFLEEQKDAIREKPISVFLCQSGNGGERVLEQIRSLLGISSFASTVILIDPLTKGVSQQDTLEAFLESFSD